MSDILSFHNVLFSDSSEYSDEEYKLTLEAINESIEKLKVMRVEEGKQLVVDLQNRVDIIDNTVDKIDEFAKTSVDEYFQKLKERAKELVENIDSGMLLSLGLFFKTQTIEALKKIERIIEKENIKPDQKITYMTNDLSAIMRIGENVSKIKLTKLGNSLLSE